MFHLVCLMLHICASGDDVEAARVLLVQLQDEDVFLTTESYQKHIFLMHIYLRCFVSSSIT